MTDSSKTWGYCPFTLHQNNWVKRIKTKKKQVKKNEILQSKWGNSTGEVCQKQLEWKSSILFLTETLKISTQRTHHFPAKSRNAKSAISIVLIQEVSLRKSSTPKLTRRTINSGQENTRIKPPRRPMICAARAVLEEEWPFSSMYLHCKNKLSTEN